jgi:hypothetical protein
MHPSWDPGDSQGLQIGETEERDEGTLGLSHGAGTRARERTGDVGFVPLGAGATHQGKLLLSAGPCVRRVKRSTYVSEGTMGHHG